MHDNKMKPKKKRCVLSCQKKIFSSFKIFRVLRALGRRNVVDELLSAAKSEFRVGRRIAPERGRCRLSGRA